MFDRLKLLSLQSALFARQIDLSNPLSIAQGINSASANVFDGPPAILPIQKKTPPNVPLIILKDSEEKHNCSVSQTRVDYRFTVQKDPPCDIRGMWKNYYTNLRQITEYFCKKNPTPIIRLGLVAQFFIKLSDSANKHILNSYIQPGIMENAWDINVNFLNRFSMENQEVNRWLKIRPIRNRKDPKDDSAMLVEIDINTMQENQIEMVQEDIEAFYEDSYLHMVNQDVKGIILD